jgi:hypothetical protein
MISVNAEYEKQTKKSSWLKLNNAIRRMELIFEKYIEPRIWQKIIEN